MKDGTNRAINHGNAPLKAARSTDFGSAGTIRAITPLSSGRTGYLLNKAMEMTLPTKKPSAMHGYQMWLGTESNRRHKDFQSSALPTELPSLIDEDRETTCIHDP